MRYDFTYKESTEDFLQRVKVSKPADGQRAQGMWLTEFPQSELEEAERLNILLPVIKWEIENDMLTEELSDELYLYFEDLQEGRLDGVLNEEESPLIIKDLTECYKKVFE